MHPIRAVALLAAAFPSLAAQAQGDAAPARELGVVTVPGGPPSALPERLPATTEGVTREQIEQGVNATDSEDALKYLPSLLVRKRYVGDYNHAVLSSRASGTGNSARSAVYADGMLLSNFLGNGVGGLGFPPRWGLVAPEEIERVDVLYGPYAAMYPGNSVGAVVEYVTRMPQKFEAHGQAGFSVQPFDLYGTQRTYRSWQAGASVGNRNGGWAWWLAASHTDSQSQPLTFATRLASAGGGNAGTPVSGAVPDRNSANQPWWLLGTGTEYRTQQDHLKAKATYDIDGTLRASYVFGLWQNQSQGQVASYLRDAAGQPVYGGTVNIAGRSYALAPADFAPTTERLTHFMHGASIKSHTGGRWDWEAAASLYDYHRDDKHQGFAVGGPGTLADGAGSGWNTLALRGTWRPQGAKGAHVVDLGVQQERYRVRYVTTADTDSALLSRVGGGTQLQSAWVQDAWQWAPRWKAVLGLRGERWSATDGHTQIATATPAIDTAWRARSETHLSPKAAVSWQARPDLQLRAAAGRAVRMPTVAELYGATATANAQFINDPALKPEQSRSGELSLEKDLGRALLRLTWFAERTHDALYSQTTLDAAANRNVTRVQNVGRIATQGLELALSASDAVVRGLDFNGSVTYADSRITQNAGFASVPGDTIDKRQPNIPRWRATAQAIWRVRPDLSASLAVRYSGPQFRTLDNSDTNGFSYMGVSRFVVADVRLRWQVDKHTSAAVGIDNLNNAKYWNFHPYPQRSLFAELKSDF